MAERRTEHLRNRYGICLNDACPRCKSKEVQEIPSRKEFVCAECGKPLRECPPPKKRNSGKLIGIIAAAVVVLGGVGYAICAWNSSDKTVVEQPAVPEPLIQEPEIDPDPETTLETDGTETNATPAKPKGPSVSWGKYTGPENGRGGEISVTKAYSLVIDKIKGTTLELKPGDSIEETKFVDGELRQGVWVHDGTRQFFTR